jgi:hypothetical protein
MNAVAVKEMEPLLFPGTGSILLDEETEAEDI